MNRLIYSYFITAIDSIIFTKAITIKKNVLWRRSRFKWHFIFKKKDWRKNRTGYISYFQRSNNALNTRSERSAPHTKSDRILFINVLGASGARQVRSTPLIQVQLDKLSVRLSISGHFTSYILFIIWIQYFPLKKDLDHN